jgi:hypothetical protein
VFLVSTSNLVRFFVVSAHVWLKNTDPFSAQQLESNQSSARLSIKDSKWDG